MLPIRQNRLPDGSNQTNSHSQEDSLDYAAREADSTIAELLRHDDTGPESHILRMSIRRA
jgi:hypothetical protein